MRKKYYLPLLAVVLLFSFSASSQRSPFVPPLNDLQTERMKGSVKSIEAKYYTILGVDGSSFEVEQAGHTITSYDKNGNRTQYERKQKDGTTTYKIEYHYNEKGRNVGFTSYLQGEMSTRSVMQLNSKGNEVGAQSFDENGQVRKRWVYLLDADGRAKEVQEYDSKGVLVRKTLNYYYKDDNKNSEKVYDKDGLFKWWHTYTYNNKGLLIEKKKYHENGTPEARTSFTYDTRDNLVERVEAIQNAANTTRYIYTYDSNNNSIGLKKFDRNEKLLESQTYTYTYDANGNWLEKLESKDGVHQMAEIRTITYY